MALTQTHTQAVVQPISLKQRGKKRAYAEVSTSPAQTSLSEARNRGIILAFIDKAFANFKRGDRREYHELLSQFQPGPGKPAQVPLLKSWLEALTQSVSQFDKQHASLASAIIDLPWVTFDEAFVKVYVRFVCVLVAARPEYLKMLLDKAVKTFKWQNAFQLGSDFNSDLTKREVYTRVHYLLRTLIEVVPSTPATLLPLLERNFPPQRDRREAQIVYYTNVLKIMAYVPHLTEGILEMVVAKAIKIDVEIQVDIEDLEEYEGALDDAVFGYTLEDPFNKPIGQDDSDESDAEADATLPFDFDDLSSEGSAGEDDDNTLDGHEPRVNVLDKPEAVAQLKEMAGKLDSILRVIFSEFEAINRALSPPRFTHGAAPHASSSPNKLTPVGTPIDGEIQRRTIFDALLTVFDHVVLRTFKTRHTQFLLFWYSSLHPDFNDRFTATLIHTALYDAARPAVARISASSYLASYISRAKFVSPENTRIAVRLLCDWLETEFHEHAPSPVSSVASFFDPPAKAMKAQQLAVFYAVFQAAIYMFCYRWKDLCFSEMEDEEDEMAPAGTRRWLPQLTVVKDIIFSHLNPLKFCSANVVRQFVRIAHHVHFSYCYTVLERNNRARRSSPATPTTPRPFSLPLTDELKAERTEQAIAGMLEEAKIETHFPFDPYKLPLTSRYIDGIFKEFEAPEGMVDEEEDSSDEEAAVVAVLDGTQPLSVSSGSTSEDAAFSTSFDSQMSLG